MSSIGRKSGDITEANREQIRLFQKAHPRMKYREIGAVFGVSTDAVRHALGKESLATKSLPRPILPAKVTMGLPTCAVKQPDSIISPIPLSRLMAGR
jgi:hypothetical protein